MKDLMLILLKDLSDTHTISSLSKNLGLSRVGVWKIVKKLESGDYVKVKPIGSGKTSTSVISVNWSNPLVEKSLVLYLSEEAVKQKRWRSNFSGIGDATDFLILFGSVLHSPKKANDIDIIGVAEKRNFIEIQSIIDDVQKTQIKKIHSINFTKTEFKNELKKPNKAVIDALKRGVVLFGQENFVKFMKAYGH